MESAGSVIAEAVAKATAALEGLGGEVKEGLEEVMESVTEAVGEATKKVKEEL